MMGCNGESDHKNTLDAKDSIKPNSNIKVNKEFDKDGNLIRYDSAYSYYYSNIGNDSARLDSVFNSFKKRFNQEYSFAEDPLFKSFFFEDSLLQYDFYKKDFFSNRYRNNMGHIDSLFREMDLMKNNFFRKQPESLVPKR